VQKGITLLRFENFEKLQTAKCRIRDGKLGKTIMIVSLALFMKAVENGDVERLKKFLRHEDAFDFGSAFMWRHSTCLMLACKKGHTNVVEILMEMKDVTSALETGLRWNANQPNFPEFLV